jgi:prepilin-type N-terminal cleavage/methylation domain-containing protein
MPISAERRPPADRPRPPRAACAGFTLLEVMVTLAIVVGTIVPLLFIRDAAWNMALRTSNMMRATTYAEELLAEHLLDPDDRKEWPGVVEDDPVFRYEITIETYDLSTGRVESEEQQGFGENSNFSSTSAFVPKDALEAPPTGAEEAELDNPHRCRRYRIVIHFPGYGEDEEELEYVLEGYAPVAREEPLPGAKG